MDQIYPCLYPAQRTSGHWRFSCDRLYLQDEYDPLDRVQAGGALITAIVVIFQPELRKVVEQLGQKKIMASIIPFDSGRKSRSVCRQNS